MMLECGQEPDKAAWALWAMKAGASVKGILYVFWPGAPTDFDAQHVLSRWQVRSVHADGTVGIPQSRGCKDPGEVVTRRGDSNDVIDVCIDDFRRNICGLPDKPGCRGKPVRLRLEDIG